MSARLASLGLGLTLALACGGGCSRKSTPGPSATDAGAPSAALDASAIERATDRRSATELVALAGTGDGIARDALTRRRIARGLARIADDTATTALLPMLADEDPVVAAWAAYGLGFGCKGHEDAFVKALAARAETLRGAADAGAPPPSKIDATPSFALPRALGRCGGALAERTLVGFVRARPELAEAAAFALGDLAQRQGTLSDETVTALLDAVPARAGAGAFRAALQPFSRQKSLAEGFLARVVDVSRGALREPGPDRIFAVRALAKAQGRGTTALASVVVDRSFTIAERAEAARGLAAGGRDEAGRALGAALVDLISSDGAMKTLTTSGEIHVALALVDGLADLPVENAPAGAVAKALYNLAAMPPPAAAPPADALRVELLRCHAAAALARTDLDAEVLVRCAAAGRMERERAELHALLKATTAHGVVPSLVGTRRTAFARLARSEHLSVREAALEALGAHSELGPLARTLAGEALATKKPGLVATVADAITQTPATFAPADAKGPGLGPELATAFDAALAEAWAPDLVETRVALLDAAVASLHPRAKELALAACHDVNVTVRARGEKALAALGTRDADCRGKPGDAAKEIDALLVEPVRVRLDAAGRPLSLLLDPGVAPVTVTRLVALARAGFYKGVVIHRVVPGFVVQLGDPGADGYGGSGAPLRCETSPLPFTPSSVGMALAGRDTGSSQFFVTLSRTPHLDGDYALVGRAEGEWDAIVEGDVVGAVSVEDAR